MSDVVDAALLPNISGSPASSSTTAPMNPQIDTITTPNRGCEPSVAVMIADGLDPGRDVTPERVGRVREWRRW